MTSKKSIEEERRRLMRRYGFVTLLGMIALVYGLWQAPSWAVFSFGGLVVLLLADAVRRDESVRLAQKSLRVAMSKGSKKMFSEKLKEIQAEKMEKRRKGDDSGRKRNSKDD